MRAPVRPAAVQRPEHPVLVANEQSHLHQTPPSYVLVAHRARPQPPIAIPPCVRRTALLPGHINQVLRSLSTRMSTKHSIWHKDSRTYTAVRRIAVHGQATCGGRDDPHGTRGRAVAL